MTLTIAARLRLLATITPSRRRTQSGLFIVLADTTFLDSLKLSATILNIAFTRKLTGRMASPAYGGIRSHKVRVPVGGQSSRIGGNLGVTLTYGFEHGGLTGGYFHDLSGGSRVSGLARPWIRWNFGRHPHSLQAVDWATSTLVMPITRPLVSSTATTFPNYNNWFFGGGVSRPFGRNTTHSDCLQREPREKYNVPDCTVGSCNSSHDL